MPTPLFTSSPLRSLAGHLPVARNQGSVRDSSRPSGAGGGSCCCWAPGSTWTLLRLGFSSTENSGISHRVAAQAG